MGRILISEEEKRRILGMHVDKGYTSMISEQPVEPQNERPVQQQPVSNVIDNTLKMLQFPSSNYKGFVAELKNRNFKIGNLESITKGYNSGEFNFKFKNGQTVDLFIPNQDQFKMPTKQEYDACRAKIGEHMSKIQEIKKSYPKYAYCLTDQGNTSWRYANGNKPDCKGVIDIYDKFVQEKGKEPECSYMAKAIRFLQLGNATV